jgi:hypothetical protein
MLAMLFLVTTSCTSFQTEPEGASPELTSSFAHDLKWVGAFSIDGVTTAPLQIVAMAYVELPCEDVFDLTVAGLSQWVPQVEDVAFDHSLSSTPGQMGVGSLRTSTFDGSRLQERIEHWDPPRSYAFRILVDTSEADIPITDHMGLFLVESKQGGSLITWRQYFQPDSGLRGYFVTGFLKDSMMRTALDRLAQQHGGTLVTPSTD